MLPNNALYGYYSRKELSYHQKQSSCIWLNLFGEMVELTTAFYTKNTYNEIQFKKEYNDAKYVGKVAICVRYNSGMWKVDYDKNKINSKKYNLNYIEKHFKY